MTQAGSNPWQAALVIVAHPDDEIIWCGGLILQNSAWNWTILSLCRAGDRDREPRFRRVCAHLGAEGIISDLDDGDSLEPVCLPRDIHARIRQHTRPRQWDLCVTHGANGEYGHARHMEIHQEVMRLFADGRLPCNELWTFAYACDVKSSHCLARHDSDIRAALTLDQLEEKKRIIRDMYGFGPDSFEMHACISPEAFDRHLPKRQGVTR